MRIRVSIDDVDAERSESGQVANTDFTTTLGENGTLEPYVGMEFESDDAAKCFYVEYARQVGFNTKICQIGNFRPYDAVTCQLFVCAKEGSKKKFSDPCKAMLKIELKGNKWVITKFVKEHNHALEKPINKLQIIQPRKHFGGGTKNVAETNQTTIPSGVMYLSIDGNHQVRSGRPPIQKRIDFKDSQNMLEYLKKMQAENPGFFYAIQLDEDNRMANVFWADARSRTAYTHFGDVVTLDTSFKTKQYKVPFAPFTGVNHHGQTILFGCALLQDDSEPSFVWLFRTFLTAMSDRPPISIVTDQDGTIKAAINQVLPKARHCVSKWDVLREGQEKLAHVYITYPNFQMELYSCINLTDTIEEFESSWVSIINKYDLKNDCWLQSLYNTRKEWAPVYFRGSFFATLSPNQGFDSSFFDSYVNQETCLPVFFKLYERVMDYWFEKEIEADFDTIHNSPVLRTPSPMEKQAANLYTRKIFEKFQDELVETFVYTANKIDSDNSINTYRVAKFEDDHISYTVNLNVSDTMARCSCQMFEYSGIVCRHILTVFTVTNVLILPSHYILRRWTRNAKNKCESDECVRDYTHETIASRYNSLCLEGFRYAEEGAIDSETYFAAINALREGEKKISVLKKNIAKVIPQKSQELSGGYDNRKSSSTDTPLLWPNNDEVARGFNLNDSIVVPKSIGGCTNQDDNGSFGNMVVLPCLKSMTWVMENKNSTPENRVAIINLKLQDYSKSLVLESEVKFKLSMVTLEPMLRSMAHISEQLFTPANKVAVINLKLQDIEAISGESLVKFQVSQDTLCAMLRSMAYIREQLSVVVMTQPEPPYKKHKR